MSKLTVLVGVEKRIWTLKLSLQQSTKVSLKIFGGILAHQLSVDLQKARILRKTSIECKLMPAS